MREENSLKTTRAPSSSVHSAENVADLHISPVNYTSSSSSSSSQLTQSSHLSQSSSPSQASGPSQASNLSQSPQNSVTTDSSHLSTHTFSWKKSQWIIYLVLALLSLITLWTLYYIYRSEIHAAIFMLLHHTWEGEELRKAIRGHSIWAIFLFIPLISLLAALPGAPISPVCFVAGVCYGSWIGLFINIIGVISGDIIDLLILRSFHKKIQQTHKQARITKKLLALKYPLLSLTVGYMIPLIPTVVVDYVAVKIKATWKMLAFSMAIGALPISFLYAFVGDSFLRGDTKRLTVAVAILVIFAIVLVALWGWEKYGESKEDEKNLKKT